MNQGGGEKEAKDKSMEVGAVGGPGRMLVKEGVDDWFVWSEQQRQ